MKSLASPDVSANSGSSKFHLAAKMLFRVSLSSSPRNGERPLRLWGRDPFLFWFFYNSSHMHLCTQRCSLTACTWWHRGSTCPCWRTQSRSWLPREQETLEYRNSPEASPAVYSCVRDYNLNPCVLHYSFHQLDVYSHSSQAKVDDFDLVGESAHTEDIFRLESIRKHNNTV